jgi:glycosyltransferase involved in cell wall biosynthesis
MNRIAVILPNWQQQQYLPDALNALQNQSQLVDFWVVDDEPRMGKGFRMNTVIPHVKHEWVNVHDADDISLLDRTSSMNG